MAKTSKTYVRGDKATYFSAYHGSAPKSVVVVRVLRATIKMPEGCRPIVTYEVSEEGRTSTFFASPAELVEPEQALKLQLTGGNQ